MKSFKDALQQTLAPDQPRSLQAQLDHKASDVSDQEICRSTLRIPAVVIDQLHDLARSRNVSTNEIIAVFIDQGLVAEGRPSIAELAPWFAGYLRRAPKREAEPDDAQIFQ